MQIEDRLKSIRHRERRQQAGGDGPRHGEHHRVPWTQVDGTSRTLQHGNVIFGPLEALYAAAESHLDAARAQPVDGRVDEALGQTLAGQERPTGGAARP